MKKFFWCPEVPGEDEYIIASSEKEAKKVFCCEDCENYPECSPVNKTIKVLLSEREKQGRTTYGDAWKQMTEDIWLSIPEDLRIMFPSEYKWVTNEIAFSLLQKGYENKKEVENGN